MQCFMPPIVINSKWLVLLVPSLGASSGKWFWSFPPGFFPGFRKVNQCDLRCWSPIHLLCWSVAGSTSVSSITPHALGSLWSRDLPAPIVVLPIHGSARWTWRGTRVAYQWFSPWRDMIGWVSPCQGAMEEELDGDPTPTWQDVRMLVVCNLSVITCNLGSSLAKWCETNGEPSAN